MRIQTTLSLLLAIALVGGCSSPSVIDDDLGSMRGKVALSDLNCNPLSNRSGAAIHIEGTGFFATTDTNGEWEIDHVPAGIYNIIIAKPGFDTDLVSEYQFSGAGTQFLEHEAVHAVPMDSVLILSVLVTKKDSTRTVRMDSIISVMDSIRNWAGRMIDTTIDSEIVYYINDTVGYEYFLTITLTMHGPDSAISFVQGLTNVTHPSSQYYLAYSDLPSRPAILKNGTFVSHLTLISPKGYPGYLQPGDSLVVTTYPVSACGQNPGPNIISKGFVLQ